MTTKAKTKPTKAKSIQVREPAYRDARLAVAIAGGNLTDFASEAILSHARPILKSVPLRTAVAPTS